MKPAGKTSFFLLVIFSYNLWGYLFSFNYFLSQGKQELRALRNSAHSERTVKLLIIKKGSKDLRWIKGDEFIFNDRYYDVLKSDSIGDHIRFHVFEDKKEYKAKDHLDKHLNEINGKSSRPAKYHFKGPEKEYAHPLTYMFLITGSELVRFITDTSYEKGFPGSVFLPPRFA